MPLLQALEVVARAEAQHAPDQPVVHVLTREIEAAAIAVTTIVPPPPEGPRELQASRRALRACQLLRGIAGWWITTSVGGSPSPPKV